MERTIKLRDGKGGFVIYTVFDVIRYKPKDGLRIQFNHNMRPFLLDIYESRKGYTRIGLKQIFQLSSAYAIRLLELMLQYRGTMQGKKIVRHIEVDVSMDELDVTAAESKATYNEIRDYVWEHHQLKVSNLYIAQVKQKYGIIERENHHKAKNENAKQPKCPKEKEDAIVEALKHFQMI